MELLLDAMTRCPRAMMETHLEETVMRLTSNSPVVCWRCSVAAEGGPLHRQQQCTFWQAASPSSSSTPSGTAVALHRG